MLVEDRREHPRRQVTISAQVALAPGQPLPSATCIDISKGGLLLTFDEPIGLPDGHRLVASLDLPNGHFHALGAVVRTGRGVDFHTYAAIKFLNVQSEDFVELSRQLDLLDQIQAFMPGI